MDFEQVFSQEFSYQMPMDISISVDSQIDQIHLASFLISLDKWESIWKIFECYYTYESFFRSDIN